MAEIYDEISCIFSLPVANVLPMSINKLYSPDHKLWEMRILVRLLVPESLKDSNRPRSYPLDFTGTLEELSDVLGNLSDGKVVQDNEGIVCRLVTESDWQLLRQELAILQKKISGLISESTRRIQ